jgi:hypothetical protein
LESNDQLSNFFGSIIVRAKARNYAQLLINTMKLLVALVLLLQLTYNTLENHLLEMA